MTRERRKGLPPVPANLNNLITVDQKLALKELESFGWEVEFVRRPLFQDPRIFISNPATGKRSVIESDGTVDHNPIENTNRASEKR
jgi:hypothetical protein